jgi:glutamyl-tRNA synthetase
VRADDLLASTARQILLMQLLGTAREHMPAYAHVPMVVAADGERLAKRAGSATIRGLHERGIAANEIAGELAHGLGLVAGDVGRARALAPRDIAASLQPPSSWRKTPWAMPAAWS